MRCFDYLFFVIGGIFIGCIFRLEGGILGGGKRGIILGISLGGGNRGGGMLGIKFNDLGGGIFVLL